MKRQKKNNLRIRLIIDITIMVIAFAFFVITLVQGINKESLPLITGPMTLLYVIGIAYFVPQLMGIGVCFAAAEDLYTAVTSKR